MQYLFARLRHRLDVYFVHQAASRLTERVEKALHRLRQARGRMHLRLAVYLRHEPDGNFALMMVARPASGTSEELRALIPTHAQEVVDTYNEARLRSGSSLPPITELVALRRASLPEGRTVEACIRRAGRLAFKTAPDGGRASDSAHSDIEPASITRGSGSDPTFGEPGAGGDRP